MVDLFVNTKTDVFIRKIADEDTESQVHFRSGWTRLAYCNSHMVAC